MNFFKDLCAAFFVTLLFLLLAEGMLRVAGVKFEGSFYTSDRELGYALRPNAHGWNVAENQNYFRVNSDGMADREHTLQPPPGVIRIAVVGDSVSEAKHVPLDQAYWAVMERTLNSHLPPGGGYVEVLNFGVAGYGLPQDALVIEKRIWKYHPQIILLAGTVESFVLRSSRRLSPNSPAEHVPFYKLTNGILEPDAETRKQRAAFGPSGKSRIWFADLVNASRLVALCNAGYKKALENLHPETNLASGYKESDAFLGPATPDLAAAWDIAKAMILKSRDEARRHQAELWLFTLDMPQQVDPDPISRAKYAKSLGIPDLFQADCLFASFAAAQQIPHATLAPQLLGYAERNHVFLHGFSAATPYAGPNSGHWNQLGHKVAGEIIAGQLLEHSKFFCCGTPLTRLRHSGYR
jgi:hypothetical protein